MTRIIMGKSIKIIAGLLSVIVIATVVVISTLDVNQYKTSIIEATEQATGRKLQIGGDLRLALSFVPTVVVEDVKFSNASWGSKPEMLSLNKLEVQVSLLPLITGNIQVDRIILLEPEVLLETNKKGLGNWIFASEKTEIVASEPEGEGINLVVNEVHLENAKIFYKDGVTGKETKLVIDRIVTESNSVDDPLSVIMKVAYNELPIEVKGTLGSLNKLPGNDSYPIDLTINVSAADITLKGQIAKTLDGQKVDIDIGFYADSLSDLSELAGSDLPEVGPVSFTGKVINNKGAYSIKTMKLALGNTDLSGEVTANISGKRPTITANLISNVIDLIELMGDEQQAKEDSKERLFSSKPLPLEGLKSVNANVTVNAKLIKTNKFLLEDANAVVIIKNGNLVINPLKGLLASGDLNGNISLKTRGKTAILAADIEIKGFEQ